MNMRAFWIWFKV